MRKSKGVVKNRELADHWRNLARPGRIMNWTVLYTPKAEQDLAAVWMAAFDPSATTAAANHIDRLLSTDPERTGEVSFDSVRAAVVPPPGVEFEVVDQDRMVWVLSVWDSTKSAAP